MKNSKGITLMALVITIIVLLILASISIGAISGNNSLINQAIKSKDDTGIAEEKELVEKCVAYAKAKHKYGSLTKTDLEDQLEIYTQDRTYVDPESDNPIKVTFTDSGRTYLIDLDGNVTQNKPREYSDEVKTSLTQGKYVTYNEQPYIVLYDVNSEYGWIEIISENPLESLTLGYNDPTIPNSAEGYDFTGTEAQFEKSRWSYNNAIETLNNVAQKYLTDLADRARCVGSNPEKPLSENNQSYSLSLSSYHNMPSIKDGDINYKTDYSNMTHIGCVNISDTTYGSSYAFASRSTPESVQESTSWLYFYISGGLSSSQLFTISSTSKNGYTRTTGFRPVIRLKDSIRIMGGVGTSNSPYILGL